MAAENDQNEVQRGGLGRTSLIIDCNFDEGTTPGGPPLLQFAANDDGQPAYLEVHGPVALSGLSIRRDDAGGLVVQSSRRRAAKLGRLAVVLRAAAPIVVAVVIVVLSRRRSPVSA